MLLLAPASAGANHYLGLHWPGGGERWINVYESWDRNNERHRYWLNYYYQAVNNWNRSSYILINRVSENQNPYECVPRYRGMHLCQGWYGPTGWDGLMQVMYRWNTPHFEVNRILLNDWPHAYNYGQRGSGGTCAYAATCGQVLKHLECHELGHGLGLAHDTAGTGCMRTGDKNDPAYAPAAGSYTTPRDHDYSMLAYIHGHGDSRYGDYVYYSGGGIAETMGKPREITRKNMTRRAIKPPFPGRRDHKERLERHDLPPRGSCRPKQVSDDQFVQRVCEGGKVVDEELIAETLFLSIS